jgi:hypothetical protein
MNKWKFYAILFTLMSIGGVREIYTVSTSTDPNNVAHRTQFVIMTSIFTAVVLFFTIRFWKKASSEKKFF